MSAEPLPREMHCGNESTVHIVNSKCPPFDRYCASCGARRLIIFDQLRQYLYIRSPYVVIGLSVVLGAAWLGLRYALRDKLK
ncbi:hypothetical protein Y032_0605g568 [Ancylostoma ceylanicum]|uniref:Uncharacterized protein n=1 Tax=Ancylostoma ceylanicum TaxID=53326 RepID=A0A016WNL0_9BILA|nr:hypothetical protein Y032_0605g568 [Ancylostoma ceylanicum]